MATYQIKRGTGPDQVVYAVRIDVANTPYRSYCVSYGPFATKDKAEAAMQAAIREHARNGVLYAGVVRATFWQGENESGCTVEYVRDAVNERRTSSVYFELHQWQGGSPEELRYAPISQPIAPADTGVWDRERMMWV